MADLKDFAEQLVNLTVKEVTELADILKEEYGIELLLLLLQLLLVELLLVETPQKKKLNST